MITLSSVFSVSLERSQLSLIEFLLVAHCSIAAVHHCALLPIFFFSLGFMSLVN